MQNTFRVLHIFSGYGGGISSLILNLIENKTKDIVFDTLAFSYKDGEEFIRRLEVCGTKCFTMPRPRIEGYKKFIGYVNKLMEDRQYDAIHCHIVGWMAIPFKKAAKKYGVKTFLLHAHTTKYDSKIDRIPLIHRFDQAINYRCATAYITCSDMAADYIFGEKYLKKRKAILIPNGISKNAFEKEITEEEKQNYRNEIDIDADKKVILHVGRFSPPKNHMFILDIISELKKKNDLFVFVLVGDGELFDQVKERSCALGLDKHIRFLGRRNDIAQLMQFADCMILPSANEGLPTVAIECQAAGTKMLLSEKITRQCDMGLGLLKMLSIDSVKPWVDELVNLEIVHQPTKKCIDVIENNNFTAAAAGKCYCNTVREYILQG